MGYIAGLLLISTFSLAWVPGAVILLVAAYIFLVSLQIEFSSFKVLVILSFVIAPPIAAYIAGTFLERYCFSARMGNSLAVPASVLALALMLGSDVALEYFAGALELMAQASNASSFPIFLSVCNAAFFCGALIAFCLMMAQVLLELPMAWFNNVSRVHLHGSMAAVRPFLILLVFSLSISLVTGLFVSELNPVNIIRGAAAL